MDDLQKMKKSGDKKQLKKLRDILGELQEHPLTGTGNPERLRFRPNTYSRRISKEDRIVYSIHDDVVVVNILQMLGHYNDK